MTRLTAVQAALNPDPQTVWATLAPKMAARGRMRVSRDGGRNYRARDERAVTETLPNQPAALLVYDSSGRAPIISLDLDASRGDVAADLANLQALLSRCGARYFTDSSPNSGRHIYVPLAEPAPLHEVRALMRALAARTPTLDPSPMLNIAAGCIRPPGARHRTGGHQSLDGSLSAAVHVLHQRTPTSAWKRLLAETAPWAADATAQATARSAAADGEGLDIAPQHHDETARLEPLSGFTEPDATFVQIARTGQWPAEKYSTASEARQAVLWATAAAGWALVDVARRLEDGTWPGLASLYARYSARHRRSALGRDWRKAVAFEAARRARRSESQPRKTSVRVRTTSPQQTHRGQGGSVNTEVRVWLAAVDMLTRDADLAVRAVLYALAEAAALTGDLVVEHGNRSLAIATGLDQSTVGRALKALREAPKDRLLIDLVRPADRTRAASYALVVPDLLRPACERKPWRRGRIHAVRPVFRELGLAAAFVYAALEQHDAPVGGRELAAAAGLGHTAGYDALMVLSSWGLASRVRGGWVLGQASPERLAEQFGVDEAVAAQVKKYREERLAWWRYLGIVDDVEPQVAHLDDWRVPDPPGPTDSSPPRALAWTPPTPPTPLPTPFFDDTEALVGLLGEVLGATVIGVRG